VQLTVSLIAGGRFVGLLPSSSRSSGGGGVAVRGTRAVPEKNVHIGFPYFGRPATVSMNEIDLWLERLYWIAMISLPFLAIWAGRIALRQVQTASQQVDAALKEAQTTKLLKMLQHVEEQRVLDARHVVMTEIRRQEEVDRREPYQLRQYVIFDAGKMLLDFASRVYANGGADARP
jgi:hypothetical protein